MLVSPVRGAFDGAPGSEGIAGVLGREWAGLKVNSEEMIWEGLPFLTGGARGAGRRDGPAVGAAVVSGRIVWRGAGGAGLWLGPRRVSTAEASLGPPAVGGSGTGPRETGLATG